MPLEQIGWQLIVGLLVAGIVSFATWWFRKPLQEAISTLGVTLNQVLGWSLLFLWIVINVGYALTGNDMPEHLPSFLGSLVAIGIVMVTMYTPRR